MNKRGKLIISVLCTLSLCLTACGTVPDLTEEQEEMVSQYAAGLMLKYDAANHSRFMNVDKYVNLYNEALENYKKQEQAYYDKLAKEEVKREEEALKAEEEAQAGSSSSKPNGGATVVDARTVGEVLGVPSFEFEYAGNISVNMYPEDASDISFVINATSGNDLLVTYFNVTNTSGSDATLDLLSNVNAQFKISVNGGRYISVLKTFVLEDDLSMYYGQFAPGETKRLALLTEVADGTVISTLGLRVSAGSDTITKSLK